jgi:hypothetical protein
MDLIDFNAPDVLTISHEPVSSNGVDSSSDEPVLKYSDEISDLRDNTFSAALICPSVKPTPETSLKKAFKLCKPGAKIVVKNVTDVEDTEFLLKTNGFTAVERVTDGDGTHAVAIKPKYAIGSSAKINLKKSAPAAVWKLDDDVDEAETIDPDNLLDDDDLKKPDPSSLRVCGTTGKRKACKDCSCGLADELANEGKGKENVKELPKSSCGSCYLGDAFRCASCPYLGMPAFKPGEKVQLNDNLLKADI